MKTDLKSLSPKHKYGRINLSLIDTQPGTESWAAPPVPVDDYTEWLRVQYKHHRAVPVYLNMAASMKYIKDLPVIVTGQYKDELLVVMQTVISLK